MSGNSHRGNILRNFLPKNVFSRNTTLLAGGTVIGQLLLVLASPILSRIYSPEDFGILSVFAAFLAILGVVSSLNYCMVIPLPEEDAKAIDVVTLSFAIVLFISLLVLVLTIIFNDYLSTVETIGRTSEYLFLLPLGVAFLGAYQIGYYWAIRKKAFKEIAQTRILQSSVMVAIQAIAFILGPLGLIIGHIFGQAAGVIRLTKIDRLYRKLNTNISNKVSVAKEYREQPIYQTGTSLMNNLGRQSPFLILSFYFGPEIAGFFFLSQRVLLLPINLVVDAYAGVFLSESKKSIKEGQLSGLVERVQTQLIGISMLPLGIVSIMSIDLFLLVFGEEWKVSGTIGSILCVWVFFALINGPITILFVVLKKQKNAIMWETMLIIVRILSLLYGGIKNNYILSILLFVISSSVVLLLQTLWLRKLSSARLTVLVRAIVRNVMYTIIALSILILLRRNGYHLLSILYVTTLFIIAISRSVYIFYKGA